MWPVQQCDVSKTQEEVTGLPVVVVVLLSYFFYVRASSVPPGAVSKRLPTRHACMYFVYQKKNVDLNLAAAVIVV